MWSKWKFAEDIMPSDLSQHPVWEYTEDDGSILRPIPILPVDSLLNCIVGTKLRLNMGKEVWGIISNLNTRSVKKNQHFLAVWIEQDGAWFELARYHDVDYCKRSPDKLAEFLGIPKDEVFPIKYDVSKHVAGSQDAVVGLIQAEPAVKLSQQDLIRLALEPDD